MKSQTKKEFFNKFKDNFFIISAEANKITKRISELRNQVYEYQSLKVDLNRIEFKKNLAKRKFDYARTDIHKRINERFDFYKDLLESLSEENKKDVNFFKNYFHRFFDN